MSASAKGIRVEHVLTALYRILGALPVAVSLMQVIEGETEVVNIRETDGRLGPLIFTLVGLGIVTLIGTLGFWWLTRPKRLEE